MVDGHRYTKEAAQKDGHLGFLVLDPFASSKERRKVLPSLLVPLLFQRLRVFLHRVVVFAPDAS